MNYRQQIHDYLAAHRGEMTELLKSLIRIPSVRGEAEPGAPFGRACNEVLEFTQRLYDSVGMKTELCCDGGYLLAEMGDGERSLGLFAHADVVPVADDWTFTPPFEPMEKEGCLIGRGVMDDKAAIVTSLFCARMIQELAIPFCSQLVCFTGANEESGMQDIRSYVNAHTPPDFSLVCDTAFPLYHGNKGRFTFIARSGTPFEQIKSFSGGVKGGAVMGKAMAVLPFDDALYDWLTARRSADMTVCRQCGEIVITALGLSTHLAIPEGSRNAGGMLASLLAECPMLAENDRRQMAFVAEILTKYYGEALGIACEDEVFGRLTCANSFAETRDGCLFCHFNVRRGNSRTAAEIADTLKAAFAAEGWQADVTFGTDPHLVPADDAYVQACLGEYREMTGDMSAPRVNAGGTYAVYLPRAVEIGPTCGGAPSGMPAGHGRVHQPDECANIDGILRAAEITMQMLLACDDIHSGGQTRGCWPNSAE